MKFGKRRVVEEVADVDVTSFMNLMIVLVPVLLLSMAFTQTSVLEIKLPELTGGAGTALAAQSKLEVEISTKGYKVYFPENVLIQEIPLKNEGGAPVYDFRQLSLVLQAVKQTAPDKNDVLLRSTSQIEYADIISTMDTLKSYKTVVALSVADIELFPEISLDDAKEL